MSEPLDFDDLLALEDKREADARMTARWSPLWEEAESALRTDVGLVIELAKEVNRVIEFEQGREARSERARQASLRSAATRAARKAQRESAGEG
ncbi:hypothetical protein KZC51_13240 [Microbacterium sp. SSW1-49]|uniref:Uncharacterized protein n=1 Tax=Microbacterium croceum TaxID=2851645 RepID=A0ABT0FH56_9MICO|nr:hypothetical protein [Microbacterium croceum]MCK2037096.1 hypothetical protein [Microbacterium croceum]